ncbi:hypothetical protein B0H10DRAFT_1967776 [Mycena sp. CBHHK59/15]|nr:hypothetical protein B0H10DRAFT_1967776 [Mycena sp. CBHHK59/15]
MYVFLLCTLFVPFKSTVIQRQGITCAVGQRTALSKSSAPAVVVDVDVVELSRAAVELGGLRKASLTLDPHAKMPNVDSQNVSGKDQALTTPLLPVRVVGTDTIEVGGLDNIVVDQQHGLAGKSEERTLEEPCVRVLSPSCLQSPAPTLVIDELSVERGGLKDSLQSAESLHMECGLRLTESAPDEDTTANAQKFSLMSTLTAPGVLRTHPSSSESSAPTLAFCESMVELGGLAIASFAMDRQHGNLEEAPRTLGLCASGPCTALEPHPSGIPSITDFKLFVPVSVIIWTTQILYLVKTFHEHGLAPYTGWEQEGIGTERFDSCRRRHTETHLNFNSESILFVDDSGHT